jgi:hypothetical protein
MKKSASYKKVDVLWKSRRPLKKSAPYEKVVVHWKSRRPMKKSAPYEKVGVLWKSSLPMKKLAPYKKVGARWKSWRPVKKLAPYTQWDIKIYNNYGMWPPYCLARHTPQWPLSSAPAGSLLLEVLFASLHALLLSVHGHSVASLYGWTAPILARLGCTGCWRSTQKLAFYSIVGAHMKSPIFWWSKSPQPENCKRKKCPALVLCALTQFPACTLR